MQCFGRRPDGGGGWVKRLTRFAVPLPSRCGIRTYTASQIPMPAAAIYPASVTTCSPPCNHTLRPRRSLLLVPRGLCGLCWPLWGQRGCHRGLLGRRRRCRHRRGQTGSRSWGWSWCHRGLLCCRRDPGQSRRRRSRLRCAMGNRLGAFVQGSCWVLLLARYKLRCVSRFHPVYL